MRLEYSFVVAALLAACACGGGGSKGPQLEEIPRPAALTEADPSLQAAHDERRQRAEALTSGDEVDPAAAAGAVGELGIWYHAHGFLPAALAAYRNAQRLAPQDADWHYLAAHAAREAGDAGVARAEMERALELRPSHGPTLGWLAQLSFEAGDLDRAKVLIAESMTAAPQQSRAQLVKARIEAKEGQPNSALGTLQALGGEAMQVGEVRSAFAEALRAAGQAAQADNAARAARGADMAELPLAADDPLTRVTSQRPDAAYHARLGRALFAQGDFEGASKEWSQAVEVAPNVVSLRLNLALSLLRAGKAAESVEACSAILERDGDNVQALFGRALGKIEMGDPFSANTDLETVLVLQPEHAGAHLKMADLMVADDDDEGALEHYAEAWKLSSDPVALQGRLTALTRLGRHADALAAAEEAHAARPDDRLVRLMLARLLAASPDPGARDAARARQLAAVATGETADVFQAETLAMALAQAGDFEGALAWQRVCAAATARLDGADVPLGWMKARQDAYEAKRRPDAPWAEGEIPYLVPVTPPTATP